MIIQNQVPLLRRPYYMYSPQHGLYMPFGVDKPLLQYPVIREAVKIEVEHWK